MSANIQLVTRIFFTMQLIFAQIFIKEDDVDDIAEPPL